MYFLVLFLIQFSTKSSNFSSCSKIKLCPVYALQVQLLSFFISVLPHGKKSRFIYELGCWVNFTAGQ